MSRRYIELGVCLLLASGCSHGPALAPVADIETVPARITGQFDEAVALLGAGELDAAERLLVALVDAQPQLAGPYANLGIVYAKTGRLEAAESALITAVELNPARADSWNELGIVLRRQGRFDDAEAAYRQALATDNTHVHALLNLGVLYDLYRDQPDEAAAFYARSRELGADAEVPVEKWLAELERRLPADSRTAEAEAP